MTRQKAAILIVAIVLAACHSPAACFAIARPATVVRSDGDVLALAANKDAVACLWGDGTAKVWRLSTGQPIASAKIDFRPSEQLGNFLLMDPTCSRLCVIGFGKERAIITWDVATNTQVSRNVTPPGPGDPISLPLAFSAEGSHLFAQLMGGAVASIDVSSGKVVKSTLIPEHKPTETWVGAKVSTDGSTVMVIFAQSVRGYDFAWKELWSLPIETGSAMMPPESRIGDVGCFWRTDTKRLVFVNLRDGATIPFVDTASAQDVVAVSEDHKHVVYEPYDSPPKLRLDDKSMIPIQGASYYSQCVFTTDGRRLLVLPGEMPIKYSADRSVVEVKRKSNVLQVLDSENGHVEREIKLER
jgi:hypothetical protein